MRKNSNQQQVLTKGEMEIMQRLWQSGRTLTVKELLERTDEPRPAYTTVATYMKILTAKGFVSEGKRVGGGKSLEYKPLISHADYTRRVMNDVTTSFFGGSVRRLVNFFVSEEKLGHDELKQILSMIENQDTAPQP